MNTICQCEQVVLRPGEFACIDATGHHSPEVCEPCPVSA